MQQSLDEEKQADQQLTDLAMRRINPEAAGGSPMRSGGTLEGRRNLGQPAPDYRQQH